MDVMCDGNGECVRLEDEIATLQAQLEEAQRENDQLRARAVVAEQHRTLERLSRGTVAEQLEMKLRTKLAEAELRAEAAEQALAVAQQERDEAYHAAAAQAARAREAEARSE